MSRAAASPAIEAAMNNQSMPATTVVEAITSGALRSIQPLRASST